MKFEWNCLVAGYGLLLAGHVAMAAPPSRPPTLSDAINLIMKENRPLPAIEILREGVRSKSMQAQTAAQFYAVSGDTLGTSRMAEAAEPSVKTVAAPISLTEARIVPAIAALVSAANGRRVVMLNEDHVHQQHRAFAYALMKALRAEGFTHFGAETFGQESRESLEDGAPDLKTGVYTTDPLYADLARQAKALGYSLFDYEQREDQTPATGSPEEQRLARERAQAGNIAGILNADPKARLFVYAGAGHIAESDDADGRIWMAQLLKEQVGTDPLTINQVYGTPRSDPGKDSSDFLTAERLGPIPAASVVMTPSGPLRAPGFDLTVFHPREHLKNGRPQWLTMDGYRLPCRITIRPGAKETMARAFLSSEPPNAIPMDQVLIPPRARSATLMLPMGEYRIVRQTIDADRLLGVGRIGPPRSGSESASICRPVP